ncbi:Conserved hypothetical protein [Candidatus Hamiltonella defensa (Bemisia tabaci)]|nr:Conserved hypothetical protein [Candidatus Hamiltonella defensa (Bemisia tabaci)]
MKEDKEKNEEKKRDQLVRPSGLEPPTPTMSRWCSNQLSYGRTYQHFLLVFNASEY